jgi:Fe-S-cluster containining protein
MARQMLDAKNAIPFGFNGCATCDAKCCSSNIIFASIYDLQYATKYFPVLFYVYEQQISPVYFFYYGEKQGEKCPYLKGNMCGIYEERPYACRAYPFSFEQNKPCFDDGCPSVAPLLSGGVELFDKKGVLSPVVEKDFIGLEFTKNKEMIYERSEEFVKFCLKNNFLVAYKDLYGTQPLYANFKPTLIDHLYVLHPQRIAVMRMQNKTLFEGNEDFLLYIQQMIGSYKNIEVLGSKCDHK